jgi:hypothetical protein
MALEEIAAETSTDSELQAVIKAVQTGHWYEKNDPNCRSTPHCTSGISPAELLFNRKIRNKLPSVDRLDPMPSDIEDNHEKAINNDSK